MSSIVKKFLNVLSVIALSLTYNAKAAEALPPCFTPGLYFGLSAGVAHSYNRLTGTQGMSLDKIAAFPLDIKDFKDAAVTGQTAFFVATNNIVPGGWGGPGLAILPEIGFNYTVPKSSFTMGLCLAGGFAGGAQNAQVPMQMIDTDPDGEDVVVNKALFHAADQGSVFFRVATKGIVMLFGTFGFVSGANHIYTLFGYSSLGLSVRPQYGLLPLNEFNTTRNLAGQAYDSTALVNVKSARGNVSGVCFGAGFDRQITKAFSMGGRVMVLNCGGKKNIRLPSVNYVPNGIAYNDPIITVRPFVMSAVVMLKYVFMPKKK